MNETRGNARTKPMREDLKEREINSLKDSEKTDVELKIKACLTNKSDLWKTPKFIYNYYKKNFFDPCPTNPTFNGLEITWMPFNFVNPPYSQISKWVNKALEERKKGHNSVLLIPARTDTKWFRKLVENKVIITFIQGRLHFNEKGSAPFPSMFVFINNMNFKTEFQYWSKEDLITYFK